MKISLVYKCKNCGSVESHILPDTFDPVNLPAVAETRSYLDAGGGRMHKCYENTLGIVELVAVRGEK